MFKIHQCYFITTKFDSKIQYTSTWLPTLSWSICIRDASSSQVLHAWCLWLLQIPAWCHLWDHVNLSPVFGFGIHGYSRIHTKKKKVQRDYVWWAWRPGCRNITADPAFWECGIEKSTNVKSKVGRCAGFMKNNEMLPGSQQGICIVL